MCYNGMDNREYFGNVTFVGRNHSDNDPIAPHFMSFIIKLAKTLMCGRVYVHPARSRNFKKDTLFFILWYNSISIQIIQHRTE